MTFFESSSRSILLLEHDLRANAFRVCREGKPVPTFPDHALGQSSKARHVALCLGGDGGQACIARISAEILMVAKLEKVSDTAYGKMSMSLCRIAPQV